MLMELCCCLRGLRAVTIKHCPRVGLKSLTFSRQSNKIGQSQPWISFLRLNKCKTSGVYLVIGVWTWGFFCLGVLVAKKHIMSFFMELSLCPAPGNTSFLCNCHVLAQGLMLPSAVKAGFGHGGFSGGEHWIAAGRDGEETWEEMLVSFKCSLCLGLRFFVLLPAWLTKAVLTATQSAYLHSYSCRIVKIAYG